MWVGHSCATSANTKRAGKGKDREGQGPGRARIGKGTTSVVPPRRHKNAALAAEVCGLLIVSQSRPHRAPHKKSALIRADPWQKNFSSAAYTTPQTQTPHSPETIPPLSASALPAPKAPATDNPAPADRSNPRLNTKTTDKSKSYRQTSPRNIHS